MAFVLEKHPTYRVVDRERNASLFRLRNLPEGPNEFELQWKDHKTRFHAGCRHEKDRDGGIIGIWNVHSLPLADQLPKAEIKELLDLVEDALRAWSTLDYKSFTVNFPDEPNPIPPHLRIVLAKRKLRLARERQNKIALILAPLIAFLMLPAAIAIILFTHKDLRAEFSVWACKNFHVGCQFHSPGLPWTD